MIIDHGCLLNINLEQLELLEETHAYLTDNGWVIPNWLIEMRKDVEQYERTKAERAQ